MIKNYFLLSLFVSLSFNAYCQSDFHSVESFENKLSYLGINYEGSINSNVITNDFINAVYFGKTIDDELKNNVIKKSKLINRLGSDSKYQLLYVNKNSFLGRPNLHYFLALKHYDHLDASFSRDFIKLLLWGNSQFKGQTADLSGFAYNQLLYQQFQLGLLKNVVFKTTKLSIGFGISFLKGQKNLNILTHQAQLYTHPDGEYIELDIDYELKQTDTLTHNKLSAFNGLGTSADLFFSLNINETNIWKLSITDIGFINWNHTTNNFRVDTTLRFNGVEIANIFDMQDSIAFSTSPDSIVNDFTSSENNNYSIFLPFRLHLSYQKILNKFHILCGARYYFNANHTPYVYFKLNYFITKSFLVGSNLAYGGYGTIDAGLEIAKQFKSGFTAALGTNNLDGFIFPSSATGQGVYFHIRKTF